MLEGQVCGILVSRAGESCQQENSAVVFVVSCSVENLCSTIEKNCSCDEQLRNVITVTLLLLPWFPAPPQGPGSRDTGQGGSASGKFGSPGCVCAGVRQCVQAELVRVIRHHVDHGEAYGAVRAEKGKKGCKKRCFYFHLGLLCISMGPGVWFVLSNAHRFKHLYSQRNKKIRHDCCVLQITG